MITISIIFTVIFIMAVVASVVADKKIAKLKAERKANEEYMHRMVKPTIIEQRYDLIPLEIKGYVSMDEVNMMMLQIGAEKAQEAIKRRAVAEVMKNAEQYVEWVIKEDLAYFKYEYRARLNVWKRSI